MANILGPLLSSFGVQAAGQEQRKGMNAAMDELRAGTKNAQGFQQPIYDTGLKNYQDLSDQNASGNFSMPTATPFDGGKFNFQADPGYQFTKDQGEDQIHNQAAMGGMAHSPQTTKALMSFDTGLANQTYSDAFKRNDTDRNFKKGAADTAFNQNFMNNNAAFGRGVSLMNPAIMAGNNLSNEAIGLGQGLAGIEEDKGNLSGQLAANPFMAAQGTLGQMDQQHQENFGRMQQLFKMFGGGMMGGA